MRLYLVVRSKFTGTSIPVYYYTFGIDGADALRKVELKWGDYDSNSRVRELSEEEISSIVIATDFY
jgi:hypothetical protein